MSISQANQGKDQKPNKPVPKPLEQVQDKEQLPNEFSNPMSVQRAVAEPGDASHSALRGVQRAYGNQFMQRLANNKPRHRGDIVVQTKLTVNDPDDQFEQEAEAVSESLPTGTHSTPPSADGPAAQRRTENEASQTIGAENGRNHSNHQPSSAQAVNPTPSVAALIANRMTVTSPEDQTEKEAEAVSDAFGRAPEHVPPVGESPVQRQSDNGLEQTAVSPQTSMPPIRRGVPNQLKGNLFQSAAKSAATPVSRQTAEAGFDEQEALTDAGLETPEHVPPHANMDEESAARTAVSGYDHQSGSVDHSVESQIDRKRGGGEKLPNAVQTKMEDHLDSDFSNVRVHTDAKSDSLNRSLDAEAFTTGNDVFFRNGRYAPHSEGGQKLIAHELTHVVQQGAARSKANGQRKTANSQQSTAHSQRKTENGKQATVSNQQTDPHSSNANPQSLQRQQSITTAHSMLKDAPNPVMRKAMRGFLNQQIGAPTVQRRSKADKERDKAKAKAERGKQVVENKRSDKESEKEGHKNNQNDVATSGPKNFKRETPDPKFPNKQPQQTESKDKVNDEQLEGVEPNADLGGFGWLDTKSEALPDWDTEVQKYDDFQDGNFESMGLDLSGLEGDTTGIEVDPAAREQMVMDALSGGVGGDGDFLAPHHLAVGHISDAIPFGGNNAIGDEFYSKGPKAWFGSTKDKFKKNFKDIGEGFGGIFESGASGWARAASAIEVMISILELVRNVTNVLRTIFDGLYIIAKIFAAMAKLPFVGYLFKWAVPIVNAVTAVFSPLGMMVIQINLLIRTMRPIAIAFRVIDMLYYESDPDKLMDRQAKLLGHVKGMRQSAKENIRPGISDKYKEERQAERMLIGADEMEDPRVSPFSIENSADMEAEDKADYKQKFLAQYGIPDVSDLAIERLEQRQEELPPPPLAEYGATPENDVRKRMDANAIAIMHLRRQRLGLDNQSEEIDMATEVAEDQKKVFQAQRDVVSDNQEAVQPHKKDIAQKLDKQAELKGQTTNTNKEGGKSKEGGVQLKGLAGMIINFIKFFMGPIKKSGQSTDGNQQNQLKEGPEKQIETSDATIDATNKGTAEADKRTGETKQAETDAKVSEDTLGETDDFLSTQQDEAQEGIDALQEEKDAIEETKSTLQEEEERLMNDRTEAVNDSVDWMAQWRDTREGIFADIEAELQQHYKDNEEESDKDEDKDKKEGEESDDEFGQWSVYDEQEDMGKLEGEYLSEDFEKDDEDYEFDI